MLSFDKFCFRETFLLPIDLYEKPWKEGSGGLLKVSLLSELKVEKSTWADTVGNPFLAICSPALMKQAIKRGLLNFSAYITKCNTIIIVKVKLK